MRLLAVVATALACAACATTLAQPPEPPLWSVREARFVDERALVAALARARFRFIGEVHDSAAQQAVRSRLVTAIAGEHPAIAMEIFDFGHDAALASAQAAGADAEAIATAGELDRRGWAWPTHRPVIDAALAARLPIRAANIPRGELMALARSGSAGAWQARIDATPWGERERQAMREAIIEAHCGTLPDDAVTAIALAQRVRDAAMAEVLAAAARDAGGAVLLAGNGHVRRDIGAPRYLAPQELAHGSADIVTVAFEEASPDEMRAADFPRSLLGEHPGYDYVWFTPAVARPDPCAQLQRRARPRS